MRLDYPETHSDSKTEELISHLKEYLHTVAELIKLKVIDKMAKGLSSLAVSLVLLMLFTWVIILVSIGASLWISVQMGDRFSGFFIVAGIYLVIAVIIYFMRENMIRKNVLNKLVDHLTNE
jgi:hypothetical protein